jgi:hypothetical protein
MPIINKGRFRLTDVSLRQAGNDWPTAQVITTSDVIESISNLYFTNTRSINALTIGTIPGSIAITGNLVANGLIIRNISVSDSVLSGNVTAGGFSGNTITVDAITSSVWNGLYTANVIETSSNLYFTQTRARAAFSAGDNIAITPEGVISASTQAVVSNDSETLIATANTLVYAIGRNVTDPRSILVINEGLIQIPTTDYTTTGSTITFLAQPPVGSYIEIRYFGIDSASSYSSTFFATVNTFVGTGSNVTFPLSITPGGTAYTSVIIDGVAQQTTAYSIVGSTIEFTEAPSANAIIDVRIYSGAVGASFNTRTFVGDGVTDTYAVTSGFNAQNILVFENGVAQVADVDYTVDANSVITFAAAPAANIVVQIRELGSGTANLINQITGRDLRTGNIQPFVNGAQNLGSANLAYNKLYLTGANSLILGNTIVSISGSTLTLSTAGTTTVVGASSAATDNISPFLLMGA